MVRTVGRNLKELVGNRVAKYKGYVSQGFDPYAVDCFDKDSYSVQIKKKYAGLGNDEKSSDKVAVAGRLVSKREIGKIGFGHILDSKGKIQVVIQKGSTPKKVFELFGTLDVGDFIGIRGCVYKTKRGEISVLAKSLDLLSKSVYPLPDKWHGLKDIDIRYRQRYVDLIMNESAKNNFIMRSQLVSEIRKFMDQESFLEVETPMLQPIPGGAAARPFITHHNELDVDLYLRIAPELYLKRLIVGGFEKIYEINRNFRNEGFSHKHNPEFTMMEFYWAYVNFETLMEFTEKMLSAVIKNTVGKLKLQYGGKEVDFTPPYPRISFKQALKKYAKIELGEIKTDKDAITVGKKLRIDTGKYRTREKILDEIFGEFVEKNIQNPTFITEYPVEFCSLAKRNKKDQKFVDRFELIISGMELINAYSELNNPFDQEKRFQEQVEKKAKGDEETEYMDKDYVHALQIGMPPTGGWGMGIDRLAMVLTDSHSIKEVIFFPQMKPKTKIKKITKKQ